MKYLPLNIKSNYQLLDSIIKCDDLISFCISNNISTIGITDENMFSCMELLDLCNKNNIKLVIGCDLKSLDIIVYAKNYNGYISLCNIVTKKNLDTITLEDISKYEDIIVVCKSDRYNSIKDLFSDIYIGYSNNLERNEALSLTENVLYLNEILCLNESNNKYLSYLELIKNKKTIKDELIKYNNHYIENNDTFDISTTYKFSSLIDIKFPPSILHIPIFKENAYEYLTALCIKGLNKRLNNNVSSEYQNRLLYELTVINSMGFTNYFLIVYDFILYAKKNGIMVGPGRGSAAGSLVSYTLGITEIDPLKYGLIFERFLNPERVTMPDIDIDFDSTRRDEVIEYVKNKYGITNVGNIIAFDTMLPKQVLRDTARILNIDNDRVDRLCKTINNETNFDELKSNVDFNRIVRRNDDFNTLIDISTKLCGIKRNTSVHAAGVVISDDKLSNIMPMYKNGNTIMTCYSKEYIEELGLLKMDFLSIKNLNTIYNIIKEIESSLGITINLNKISLDDKETLELFKTARTSGIFQFESSGMKSFLKNLKVDNFNTLIDAIALYRPGPRDMIPSYINRKNNKEKITYLVEELKPILSSTYGIIIYQEQVLEILRSIGNYSYAKADIIRRAMSKKKASIIESEKDNFISGVITKGYDKSVAIELYDQIIKFSNYGFNKSHSVVYSVVAFQMAYLKAHYPLYFMTYLLNTNKSSDKLKEYIDEAKLYKIEFSKISINKSTDVFYIENNNIRIPFTIVKNIASSVCEEIINERNKKEFTSLYDFMIRCYKGSVNKRVVTSLIECGAFDEFNINKKQVINNFDVILNYVNLCRDIDSSLVSKPLLEECDDYSEGEINDIEISSYGFYLSNHPVTKIDRKGNITLNNINMYFNKNISCILLVESIKEIVTKNNEKMCFIKLSDEFANIEGVIFPGIYKKINIEKGKVYKFIVKVEKRNDSMQLIINNIFDVK